MPVLLGLSTGRTFLTQVGQARLDEFDFDAGKRGERYAINRAMLDNTIYHTNALGGFREQVLSEYFTGVDCPAENPIIAGIYNPVKIIVAAYQNVFRGKYGQEIKVDEEYDEKPVNPKLIGPDSPIRRLWRMSNLDTQKTTLQEWAANYGTVGLRIVAKDNTDPAAKRVYVQIDHPGVIVDFDEDDRGNVQEVLIEYQVMMGELGEKREAVKVVERLSKTRFSKEVNGEEVLEEDQRRNALGVCPYVLLRHRDSGQAFGRWAYEGSEEIIHWLNWVITNQGESIVQHVWPQWFAAAGGPKPVEFELGRRKVAYVQQDKDTPPPIFEPLVPQLDQAGALAYCMQYLDRLQERNPEIILGQVKALAGQSGETIAKLLIPVESAVLQARSQYEDALIRAKMIGLSEGVRLGMWDLGTGMGSVEAAERAFAEGKENFAFAERPALPMSVLDQITQAQASQADKSAKVGLANAAAKLPISEREKLRLAGYTDAEIDAMIVEMQEQDELLADDEEEEEAEV